MKTYDLGNSEKGYEIFGKDGSIQCIKDNAANIEVNFIHNSSSNSRSNKCGYNGPIIGTYTNKLILLI